MLGWVGLLVAAGCGGDDSRAADSHIEDARATPVARSTADASVRPRRSEHPVFVLHDNRLLAHTFRGGALWIDAGSAGFAKYARFGIPRRRWTLGATRGGQRVAVPRRRAHLYFGLTPGGVEHVDTVSVRAHAKRGGAMSLSFNARRLGSKKLRAGWNQLSWAVPAGVARAGHNDLRFGGSEPGVSWVRVGQALGAGDSAEPPRPWSDEAIVLADGDAVTYYVLVPEGAQLVATVSPAACRVEVRGRHHEGAFAGSLRGDRGHLDLGDVEGKVVRLELRARGCKRARVTGAAITVAGAAPSIPKRGAPPRYVVLWVMDTLRADRVRPFNPAARAEVPNFERLARTGTVFNPYWVQGNESQTSHASLFTGVYPVTHGVRTAGVGGTWRIARRFHTIGMEARRRGMHTIGVTANGYVRSFGGYGRGFDFWHNLMRDKTLKKPFRGYVPGRMVLDRALEKFEPAAGRPTFLFIGTVDAHKPYVGHEPWLSRYDPGPYRGDFEKMARAWMLKIPFGVMECTWVPPKRDIQRINAIYDSDVSYQDMLLGKLLAKLDELGIADQTMLIVTADHGEEFWEHGICGHGNTSREVLLHVPLVIHYPPLFPGGVVRGGAEGVDVLPTLIDALGSEPNPTMQGASLIPVAHGVGAGYVRPSYMSQYEYAHSMRVGHWKMRVASRTQHMWNLRSDPFENKDLIASRPIERQFMTDVMSTFLVYRRRWNKQTWGVATNMTAAAAAALERSPRRN